MIIVKGWANKGGERGERAREDDTNYQLYKNSVVLEIKREIIQIKRNNVKKWL